ncbi:hypothetical protein ACSLBF_19870 (plasmid) [Pseudoalteromonas sp. T1lg65]|uniref:hypothetical protein n=1 Tax=Pseudoalteromonas sp. T1lg65 TaxID=2077101 RepID=UPI003F79D5EC
MISQDNVLFRLDFIELHSQSDYDLLHEVANSDDLENILSMLLLDDTLSDALKRQVKQQLKQVKSK